MLDYKRNFLIKSWFRCSQKRVKKSTTEIMESIEKEKLKCKQWETGNLIKVFNQITEILINRYKIKHCIYTLVDKDVCVVSVKYPKFRESELIKISVGDFLTEKSCGTNAVALSVKEKDVIFLEEEDHFCQLFHDYMSIGLPIRGINKIKGFLGVFVYRKGIKKKYWRLICELIAKNISRLLIKEMYFSAGKTDILNKTQKKILKLSAQGYKISELEKIMDIKEGSVKYHRCQIYKKLEVENIVHALAEALKCGILSLDEL